MSDVDFIKGILSNLFYAMEGEERSVSVYKSKIERELKKLITEEEEKRRSEV